jgi:iron complex outermembrane receptor protein
LFRFNFLLLFILIFTPFQIVAQSQPDTLFGELAEIAVVGYETNTNILETAASVAVVNAATISGLDDRSLLYGLNTVAGVRMEERASGSYRISIRGSALRSPFGIRNVKVYWNNVPFTEPSGSTFLNLLDATNMQSVEVLKGPAGSLYGAGNGGVLRIQSTVPFFQNQLLTGLTIGSFGALKYNAAYQFVTEKARFSLKYVDQYSDGYRQQNFLDRQVVELSGNIDFSPNQRMSTSFLYSDLNYGIPGGLNAEQFATDPRQARPGNAFVPGSVDANASIDQQALFFGLTHETTLNDNASLSNSVFGSFSNFDNPFNLDYKIDTRRSGGIRSLLKKQLRLADITGQLSAGIEYQASNYASNNYTNSSGKPGSLNFSDELAVQATTVFISGQFNLPSNWIANAGLSYNKVNYKINRLQTTLDGDTTGLVDIGFDPQLIPRLAFANRIAESLTLFAGLGYGFSPPTIEEVRTNEGSINLSLSPEIGINLETGARGFMMDGRFNFEVSTFYYRLRESIVQRQSVRGTTLFRNAGSTNQFGLELNAHAVLIDRPDALIDEMSITGAYTYHRFRFDEYLTRNGDYSGNKLTGVAPNVIFSVLQIKSSAGLYANLSYTFTDRIPLRDDNTLYANPSSLVQTKLGWTTAIFSKLDINAAIGIDNLLDKRYSLGYDINAFGGRYFQPAPSRNWFFTLKLRYLL